MTDSPKRYVSYARQSLARDEAESLSIEFQLAECAGYVSRMGGIMAGSFSDPDTKGWKRNRPGFDAMLETIRAGQADTVILFKLSRFARNLLMQEEVVKEIAEAGGELVSITEPHITTSPMIRQILGAVNENYRRDQSDWLRATFAARMHKGLHHGYPPYGYRSEDGAMVPDEVTADRARSMWDWALEGHGSPEITYRANERGWATNRGKAWAQTTVLRLLRNPVYAGHVVHRGEIVARNAHPALVTEQEYHQVQETISRRSYQRRKAAPSWAEGFVWHACGERMYLAGWEADGVVATRFRCKGVWTPTQRRGEKCPYRPASMFSSKVEAGIVAALLDLFARYNDEATVRANITAAQGATDKQRERQRTTLVKRLEDLTRQRDRLLTLVLEGKIDADLYGDRDDTLKREIAEVGEELAATPAPVSVEAISKDYAYLLEVGKHMKVWAADDPARLVPLLSILQARFVVGGGASRLEIGPKYRPYFG